jgi:HEAT repeat protein
MKKELLDLLDQHKGNIARQLEIAGIAELSARTFLVSELLIASEANDSDAGDTLFELACQLSEPIKLEILHALLLTPGHRFHQQTAKALQEIASPSSIPTLLAALENGFANFRYTGSDNVVIAKWFSHALAGIGTPEAIAVIERFAQSDNEGVSSEMKYRLKRLRATQ